MKTTKHSDGSIDVDLEGTPALADFTVTVWGEVPLEPKVAEVVVAEVTGWPVKDVYVNSIYPDCDVESYGLGARTAGYSISNRKTEIEGKYVPDTK